LWGALKHFGSSVFVEEFSFGRRTAGLQFVRLYLHGKMSEKDLVHDFIRVYCEMLAVWKVKSELYKNKQLKDELKWSFWVITRRLVKT
jgi:hypothetical protein